LTANDLVIRDQGILQEPAFSRIAREPAA